MKIFKAEESISDLVKVNKVVCDINYLVQDNDLIKNKVELAQACVGNACAFSALKDKEFKITDDVTPISSILVTDIWNANDDVFTAEEIVKASSTPHFKPINWMHRGSEDNQNENIGVMVRSNLIYGDLSSLNFMDQEMSEEFAASANKTLSGMVHIKQDGLIWSQYFPSYASKIKRGIDESNLYVSMECFFEDFGYCLRKNEDDENPLFLDRKPSNASMSKDLKSYGGSGKTKYKGQEYQIGRWLKNIIFSGQGIVSEPANKRKGKILSVIINDNKAKAEIDPTFDPNTTNPPTGPVQEPNTPLNPNELNSTTEPMAPIEEFIPKTYEEPSDGLMFYSPKEASKVGEIELGCTGYHLYQQDRHGDQPLLYSALKGDPSDLEEQMKVAQYRPCSSERELRFVLEEMAKRGLKLRRSGRLLPKQETSEQIDQGGGGGAIHQYLQDQEQTNQNNQTNENNQTQQGGTDTQTLKLAAEDKSLDNIDQKVYVKTGEIVMDKPTDQEIEDAIVLASNKLEELSAQNKTLADSLAAKEEKIKQLEAELAELNNFAASVEEIADKAFSAKQAKERLAEIADIVKSDDHGVTADDIINLDETAYTAFKNSLAKIAASIQPNNADEAVADEAAQAVASTKKSQSFAMVVPEASAEKINPAQSLIGFAMGKKR